MRPSRRQQCLERWCIGATQSSPANERAGPRFTSRNQPGSKWWSGGRRSSRRREAAGSQKSWGLRTSMVNGRSAYRVSRVLLIHEGSQNTARASKHWKPLASSSPAELAGVGSILRHPLRPSSCGPLPRRADCTPGIYSPLANARLNVSAAGPHLLCCGPARRSVERAAALLQSRASVS